VVATIVDTLVFSAVNGALANVVGDNRLDNGFDLTGFTVDGSLWLTFLAFLYYVVLEGLFGRTIGKLVTGIKVIDAGTGGRPGLLSGIVRTLLRVIDGIFGYLVALIIVVNSDRRRRLGDMAAKTLVVRA
jgi:uncharacterized RDD family membrane protein YckC